MGDNNFVIHSNGNIGMGVNIPIEKLEVNGKIKVDDIIFNTDAFENNLAKKSTFANTLYDTIHNEQINIYDSIKYACSTLYATVAQTSFIGSGSFITLNDNDLKYGLFMTAAHCVMSIINNNVEIINALYLTNPLNDKWQLIDTNNIYYDGIADVAIIKTNIDFSNNSDIPLKLAKKAPKTGDICYICGNPGGYDNLSLSQGIIRDANFTDNDGYQIVESLFITAPGIGGNSGSPIVNHNGEVIGIFTFGYGDGLETFGGGSNLHTLQKTLPVLYTFPNNGRNTIKKYLGMKWSVPDPFLLKSLYDSSVTTFENVGLYIENISAESPFYNKINSGDVILSAILPNNNVFKFGVLSNQYTLGILCYLYDINLIQINVLSKKKIITLFINLDITYKDVSATLDAPLEGGLIKKLIRKIN